MSDTPHLRLTYFDFHGGRGEAARIALSSAGIPFEDHRIKFPEWGPLKPTTPFGALPVLEVDGKAASQSNAIGRYVGKLAGLYPEDPWQALLCDQACDAIEEIFGEMTPSFREQDPEKKKALREALAAELLPTFLRRLEAVLEQAGGEWFADGRLTMADLKSMEAVRMLSTGQLDHIPKDIVEKVAPKLAEHRARVLAHPLVRAYYEKVGA